MDFAAALRIMKNGGLVSREGWNGKGMFVFRVPGSNFVVNREPLLRILGEGTQVEYGAHYDIKGTDGVIRPWIASQADLDATDWALVERV